MSGMSKSIRGLIFTPLVYTKGIKVDRSDMIPKNTCFFDVRDLYM